MVIKKVLAVSLALLNVVGIMSVSVFATDTVVSDTQVGEIEEYDFLAIN